MKQSRACGSWVSPIASADLVRGALRLSAPRLEGGRLYWLEARPDEGGRQVVVSGALSRLRASAPDGPGSGRTGDPAASDDERVELWDVREVSPPGVNVRTRVHEYGGGEYAVRGERLFFVDDAEGRIHAGPARGGATTPLTPAGAYYADLVPSDDGCWLFAVEERTRAGLEPENRLIAIRLRACGSPTGVEADGPPIVVASGHDFYASPVFSPDCDRIAYLAWDHPRMPWNGTELETVDWNDSGPAGPPRKWAGGPSESLFQPRFASDGTLYCVSDRSGWWNLHRVEETGSCAVHADAFEIGRPQWVFGQSTWAFMDDRTVLASATRNGQDELVEIDLASGGVTPRPGPLTAIGGLQAGDGWIVSIAGSPDEASALYAWPNPQGLGHADGDAVHEPVCIRRSAPFEIPKGAISHGIPRSFPSADGRMTHAFVYLPVSESCEARPGELPPLLVKSHGGPTSATSSALDPRIQFWTSRGFAVADVNYAGSTGYGRAYRDLLEARWGIVDVEDCVAVALALAEEGLVDPDRLAISGGSAGGYTTLCALTFHDAFAAGASHYGIGDLEALARDTHKFESRYTDWLVGPLPEFRSRYVERSPIHHPDRLGCPMIFFQGLEDRVVPPNQAEAMVAVLESRGITHAYVAFPGEQHGFRRAENIRTALDGELYFYSQIFGFEAPKPEGVDVVGGAG